MENATPALGTDLYRLYDADGTLLYIGISKSTMARMAQHAGQKSWWHEVARIEIAHVQGTRSHAEYEERIAIIQESPKYNKAHKDAVLLPRPVPTVDDARKECHAMIRALERQIKLQRDEIEHLESDIQATELHIASRLRDIQRDKKDAAERAGVIAKLNQRIQAETDKLKTLA